MRELSKEGSSSSSRKWERMKTKVNERSRLFLARVKIVSSFNCNSK